MSFIDDREKIIDFFNMSKNEFLFMYSYLTEVEYDETIKDVLNLCGYHIDEFDEYVDGTDVKNAILYDMMIDWLKRKF